MDYLIGAMDYQEWADVCCWYRSARNAGFHGAIVMIVYEHTTKRTIEKLRTAGVEVVLAKAGRSVNQERWKAISEICAKLPTNARVLTSDVRDVAFQKSIHSLLNSISVLQPAFIASEGWLYRDSEFNRSELTSHFPWLAETLLGETVYCCGVVGGSAQMLRKLSTQVYELCKQALNFSGDQTAWNYVVRTSESAGDIRLVPINAAEIGHFGVRDPKLRGCYDKVALEDGPVFCLRRGVLLTHSGEVFKVFHQYTRSHGMRLRVLFKNGCVWEFYTGKLIMAVRQRLGCGPQWIPYWRQ